MKITSGELLNMGIADGYPRTWLLYYEIIEAIKTAIVDELGRIKPIINRRLTWSVINVL